MSLNDEQPSSFVSIVATADRRQKERTNDPIAKAAASSSRLLYTSEDDRETTTKDNENVASRKLTRLKAYVRSLWREKSHHGEERDAEEERYRLNGWIARTFERRSKRDGRESGTTTTTRPQTDTYFYPPSGVASKKKKFRSNKEVARFLGLLTTTEKTKSAPERTSTARSADEEFEESAYLSIGRMEVKEEGGEWRAIRLWRHREVRDRVVLDFLGREEEFEGIGESYSYDGRVLRDNDGDVIPTRNVRSSAEATSTIGGEIFRAGAYALTGTMEVEESGRWRPVRLFRSRGRDDASVVLHFGENEYEGIGCGYAFDGVSLTDGDGDAIQFRNYDANGTTLPIAKKRRGDEAPRRDDDGEDVAKRRKIECETTAQQENDPSQSNRVVAETTTTTTTTLKREDAAERADVETPTTEDEPSTTRRRRSSRARKRVNYCELEMSNYDSADDFEDPDAYRASKRRRRRRSRKDDDDDFSPDDVVADVDPDDEDDGAGGGRGRRRRARRRPRTAPTTYKPILLGDDGLTPTIVSDMIDLAKQRRAAEKKRDNKKRDVRRARRLARGLSSRRRGTAVPAYYDHRLAGGDIATAPAKVLRKQFMRTWKLLSDAHDKGDHDCGGHGLKFQTACSGTDGPIIAMQMCREMASEALEAHGDDVRGRWAFDFEHNMSCEVVPFKQAYLTRNFCGPDSDVVVFADIMDLANESGRARTAFGGEKPVPPGTVFIAGTSCKSFSGLRTLNRVENLQEKTISGETFFAAVAYMMKAKPYISIFENTYNAPWYMMEQYLQCRLPLWTVFLKEGSSKKGGKRDGLKAAPVMSFLPLANGQWQVCDVPGNVGVRREAVVEGFVPNGETRRHKMTPLRHDATRDPDTPVPLSDFCRAHDVSMTEHTLIFDNGGVEFQTQVIKLDTKTYGLPQTRQRGYMFVWRRDWAADVEEPLLKTRGLTLGDLFLDIVESLEEPVRFPLHGLLPKDVDPRVRRFREVLRGPIGARTARDYARNNDFLTGKSSNTKYSNKVRQPNPTGSSWQEKMICKVDKDPRHLTGWGADGKLKSHMYNVWPELLRLFDQRKRDLLEVFASKVAALDPPRDPLHHAFSWDISQNVHMAQPNSKPGITGCLTPGGYNFITNRCRAMTGAEKLMFNGIPVDRLQIGQETEVQLSDLAGNAMSLTVVSACTLAALVVKQYARERIKDADFLIGHVDPKFLASSAVVSGKTRTAGRTSEVVEEDACDVFSRLARLAIDATRSCVACLSETSGGTATSSVLRCRDCGFSVSRDAARDGSLDLDCHRMVDCLAATDRVRPGQFEANLRCVAPPTLRFTTWFDDDDDDTLCDVDFTLKTVDRRRRGWTVLYVAKDTYGRPLADMEMFVGQLDASETADVGLEVLVRRFPDKDRRGVIEPYARYRATRDASNGWERYGSSSSRRLEIRAAKGTSTRPSYRAQMGVLRFMSRKDVGTDGFVHKSASKMKCVDERWPDTIVVSSRPSDANVAGTYVRTSCMGSVCFHALWRCVRTNGPDTYMFVRPDVARTGSDHVVISTSPSYEDVSSVVVVLNESFTFERALRPNTKPVAVDRWNEWTPCTTVRLVAPTSALVVSGPPDDVATNDVRVFRVDHVPAATAAFISAPSAAALRRERLERSSSSSSASSETLELRINEAGSTAAQTRHRFSAALTPDLLRFSAGGGIASVTSSWIELPDADKGDCAWGESDAIVPPRPSTTWKTEQKRVTSRTSKGEIRTRTVMKVSPVFDGVTMNAYERKLRAIPNAFRVTVQPSSASSSTVEVSVRPNVLAHRAASALRRGRDEDAPISCRWRLSERHKEDESAESSHQFVVPTSNEYDEAPTPDAFVGRDVRTKRRYELYPRQRRALGRMLQAERGEVRFEERDWEQVDFKAIGIVAEAEATRVVPCRGGVLADVMGGGKTATSIALIATNKDEARSRQRASTSPHHSSATLVLVPPNLTSSWSTEIAKFTKTQLRVIVIESTAELMRVTRREMCEADIVVANMAILMDKGGRAQGGRHSGTYLENLRRVSRYDGPLPEDTPNTLGMKSAETLVGRVVPSHPAEPYGGQGSQGTKGQDKRNRAAFFTTQYRLAIETLRTRTDLKPTFKGCPLEYFEYERIILDECHEACCPGDLESGGGDECEENKRRSARSSKAPLAARELMGLASDENMPGERPLRARVAVWGLTGTPMLSSEARVTELAACCALNGGMYIMGGARHWRKLEHASAFDLFLYALAGGTTATARQRRWRHAQEYVTTAVQRNRAAEFRGKRTLRWVRAPMSESRDRAFRALETEERLSSRFARTWDGITSVNGLSKFIRLSATADARANALLRTIETIRGGFEDDEEQNKIVVFAPTSSGAFDAAVTALKGIEGGVAYFDDDTPPADRREILRTFSEIDQLASDRARPRILLLPFAHAAGHNFQYVSRHVVLYAPLWEGEDAVSATAKEQQAIGRVFRSGQVRDVDVWRILLQGPRGEDTLDLEMIERNRDEATIQAATSASV